MKNKLLYLLVMLPVFLVANRALAQTTLSAGDIAVFQYQSDAPDLFSFVTFVDLAAGTGIYFTDCGTSFGFFQSPCTEGAVKYTVPTGGITAGTIIQWVDGAVNNNFTNYSDSRIVGTTGVGPSTAGDALLVFQDANSASGGMSAANNPKFIFAINNASTNFLGDANNSTTQTGLPSGLSDTSSPRTALALGSGPGASDEWDNVIYNGTYDFSVGGIAAAKTAMTNPANYLQTDNQFDTSYTNAEAAIPSSLTLAAVCAEPDVPILSFSSPVTCSGSSATLNISGNLNDATQWNIYTGSCGGTLIGTTTGSSIIVSPGSSFTTYYVRGEGGCTTPTSCITISISPTAVDNASFNYDAASYCLDSADPSPMNVVTSGGTFSSTTGLSLNASSGSINVSASTPGSYVITYTTAGSCPSSSSVSVTINSLDNASFSYASSSYCVNGTDPSPTINGTTGGTFSSSTGLAIDPVNGTIDLSASPANFHNVRYTTSGTCPTFSEVFLIINNADNASFNYGASSFCANDSDPSPLNVVSTGGTFTSTAGLFLNATSGTIDLSASTPGSYTVTYTTNGTCPASSSVSVTINTMDNASFNYSQSTYNSNQSNPTPIVTGIAGGTFTSSIGLVIDSGSGTINLSDSVAGAYNITYTTVGPCINSSIQSLTIVDATAPSGYSVVIDQDPINFSNETMVSFSLSGAEVGTTYNYSFTSSNGGSAVNGAGTIATATDQITGINLSGLNDGTITLSIVLTDSNMNAGNTVTDTAVKSSSNDDLANAFSLTYGAGCTGSIYNIQNSTLEAGELIPDCAYDDGTQVVPADISSQWYSFVASISGDALIRITDNGPNLTQSPSIALTLSLFNAPSVADDVSSLGTAIQCSSTTPIPFPEILDGTFIDARGLTPGNTYYVQVYSNANNSIDYCLDISEPTIYTYNNGWSPSDPETVMNPYKRIVVLNGDAVQNPFANRIPGAFLPATVGSLYISQNASITYDNLVINSVMNIEGTLNQVIPSIQPTESITTTNQASDILTGNGKVNAANFAYYSQNRNVSPINVNLAIDIYQRFEGNDGTINFLKELTFKSNSLTTAVFNAQNFTTSTVASNAALTGNVQVEQYFPIAAGSRGRAFRFVSSPVNTTNSIYSNWQEGGTSPSGFGTHITGAAGPVGSVDGATGFDQTLSGSRSLFTFSNNTSQTWDAITSTNQVGDSLKVAEGYRLYIRGDRNVDLTTNNSSNFTVLRSMGDLEQKPISKSYDVDPNQFILTGNPYQNAVKMEDLIDNSSNILDDVFYYWDPSLGGSSGSGGAYVTYTGFDGGNAGAPSVLSSSSNGFIQPGGSVFLVSSVGSIGPNDAIIRYDPSQASITGIVGGLSGPPATSTPATTPTSISMSLYDTNSFNNNQTPSDGLLIRFGSNYSNSIGQGDHIKLMNIDESVAVNQLGNNYAVAGRDMPFHDEIIGLHHYNYGDTDYTYSININGFTAVEVFVVDQLTNTVTPLVDGLNIFNFTVDSSNAASMATDRFQLKFGNVTLGIGDSLESHEFVMYPNPAVNGEVVNFQSSQFMDMVVDLKITDLSGKEIRTFKAQFDAQGIYHLKNSTLKIGLYIIELTGNDGQKLIRKLVIK